MSTIFSISLYKARFLKTVCLTIPLFLFSQLALADFVKLTHFGANPGDLHGSYYQPEKANADKSSPAIVVLLHGCAQKAEELAQQSGLLSLAKQHNFVLLLPQQELGNNIKRCFNWYSAEDFTKDKGETLSIKNMVATLTQQFSSEKVYVIGLSVGGAMASSILVNYPELFTGGAVVAGIPFPCADGLITGISCMKNGPSQTTNELVNLIEKISPKQAIWPKLSVWTGANDSIVNPLNATMLAQQWAKLSNITANPIIDKQLGYQITRWNNTETNVQVELVEVDERGHGIMVNPNVAHGGEAADYVLAAPLSTAKHVVELWDL
ncbi:PHB depolymerase family esterase [Colwellia sp. MSW7]|uniref:PHB depolymerase family esterase n=1 Tax=Colwellia maritima TaxID=2912588 RepID=A0ABS9WZZ6_9GAMM|nr:PHB depolymerase family esterase [Colwellia maritima]MCI2282407.1 PHB depolymerase family esterase [Colwellia maritima]